MNARYVEVRSRACDLADTGDFATWSDIARALERDGFTPGQIKGLEQDRLARMMLARRADRARELSAAHPQAAAQPFLHVDVRRTWWEWEVAAR